MAIFYIDPVNGNDTNDGTTWALAWQSIGFGATAARIAPGDVIRIAKTPDPTSIGNATWTDNSGIVTLATAQTQSIADCNTVFSTITGHDISSVSAYATQRKEGSASCYFQFDTTPKVSQGQLYHSTAALDLSGYQKISFWIRGGSNHTLANNSLIINLCSDANGTVVVDSFTIPAIHSSNINGQWIPLTIARDGGGNLGSNINSIAVYTGATAPTASSVYILDNINACTTDGLNLRSLISKSSLAQNTETSDPFIAIKNIVGTSITLENSSNSNSVTVGLYYGTTETVPTYKRECFSYQIETTANYYSVLDSGSVGNLIEFTGGWDTSSTIKNGETYFNFLTGSSSGGNYNGLLLNQKSYIKINNINTVRGYYGINIGFNSGFCLVENSHCISQEGKSIISVTHKSIFDKITVCYSDIPNLVSINIQDTFKKLRIISCGSANGVVDFKGYFKNIEALNCRTPLAVVSGGVSGTVDLLKVRNGVNSDLVYQGSSTLVVGSGNLIIKKLDKNNGFVSMSFGLIGNIKINDVGGFSEINYLNGSIKSQNATTGGSGKEWVFSIVNTSRNIDFPLDLSVAKVAVVANKEVTATLYFKKSHATNIIGQLLIAGGQIAGVDDDIIVNAPSDTNRNQVTLTFTPTESGVVEILARAYSGFATNVSLIVDDISITQAD